MNKSETAPVVRRTGNQQLAVIVFGLSFVVLLIGMFGGILPGFFLFTAGFIGLVSVWSVFQTRRTSITSARVPLALALLIVSIAAIVFVLLGYRLNQFLILIGAVVALVNVWWLWGEKIADVSRVTDADSCENCEDLKNSLSEAKVEIKRLKASRTTAAGNSEPVKVENETSGEDGGRPDNLYETRPNEVDELKKINGIGPKFEGILNSIGVYTYAQVAGFSEQDVEWLAGQLGAFPDRIKRDGWVAQAAKLDSEAD
jgi:predicted flap endonuclease-1-like 5' DNA nuclease